MLSLVDPDGDEDSNDDPPAQPKLPLSPPPPAEFSFLNFYFQSHHLSTQLKWVKLTSNPKYTNPFIKNDDDHIISFIPFVQDHHLIQCWQLNSWYDERERNYDEERRRIKQTTVIKHKAVIIINSKSQSSWDDFNYIKKREPGSKSSCWSSSEDVISPSAAATDVSVVKSCWIQWLTRDVSGDGPHLIQPYLRQDLFD